MQLQLLSQPSKSLAAVARYLHIFGFKGLFFALFCLFSGKRKLVRASPRWSRQPIYLRLNSSDINVFRQVFLEREYGVSKRLHSPPNSIVDAGANIGLTAVFLAHEFPSARIYCVEPELENFELLKLNTCRLENVQVICGALWDQDVSLQLDSCDVESWAYRVRAESNPAAKGSVKGYRLRTLLQELGVANLDLLKLDIEGAEFEVLGDLSNWADLVQSIVAEIHEHIRPGCTRLLSAAARSFPHSASCGELILISKLELRGEIPQDCW